jgi:hypothetical protein
MKILVNAVISIIIMATFANCNSSKPEAEKTADSIKDVTGNKGTTGAVPVSKTGTFVKATIDGKEWEATRMLQDAPASSSYKLVHGEDNDISINFNIWKPEVGRTRKLGEDMVIDFWKGDEILGGRSGEITITRADEQWVEGTFHFTATQIEGSKIYEITNGSFRIAATTP